MPSVANGTYTSATKALCSVRSLLEISSLFASESSQTRAKAFLPNYFSRPEDFTASLIESRPARIVCKSFLFFKVLAVLVVSVKRMEQEWKKSRPLSSYTAKSTGPTRLSQLHGEFADTPLYRWLGVIRHGAYQQAPSDSTWPFESLASMWTDADAIDESDNDSSGDDQNYSVDAYESDEDDMDQQPPGTNAAPVPPALPTALPPSVPRNETTRTVLQRLLRKVYDSSDALFFVSYTTDPAVPPVLCLLYDGPCRTSCSLSPIRRTLPYLLFGDLVRSIRTALVVCKVFDCCLLRRTIPSNKDIP
jgi:hypothetical protein